MPGRRWQMSIDCRFRDADTQRMLVQAIAAEYTRPLRIMEVCGGQTHALSRYRLEELLPSGIEMVHGPGCPVCVTPASVVDQAVELAYRPDTIFCTFGDMMRVPGNAGSLLLAKSRGADVRMLYAPFDTLRIAEENPSKEVVFFAIGFETTAPVYALLMNEVCRRRLKNFSLLTALFTLPSVIGWLAADPAARPDALLAAGHVCAVTGLSDYDRLAETIRIPVAATGFEPVDLLYGIYRVVSMARRGDFRAVNAYRRVVHPSGNKPAQAAVIQFFEPSGARWRGLGYIAESGLRLRPEYEQYDAVDRFHLTVGQTETHTPCRSGDIMRGMAAPPDCLCFGAECTPDHPVGPSMVSSEGVCAAYYRYHQKI